MSILNVVEYSRAQTPNRPWEISDKACDEALEALLQHRSEHPADRLGVIIPRRRAVRSQGRVGRTRGSTFHAIAPQLAGTQD